MFYVFDIFSFELIFKIMFWLEVCKASEFGRVMFIHFPVRLSISKGRKQTSS